jgi:hypothetical protein
VLSLAESVLEDLEQELWLALFEHELSLAVFEHELSLAVFEQVDFAAAGASAAAGAFAVVPLVELEAVVFEGQHELAVAFFSQEDELATLLSHELLSQELDLPQLPFLAHLPPASSVSRLASSMRVR